MRLNSNNLFDTQAMEEYGMGQYSRRLVAVSVLGLCLLSIAVGEAADVPEKAIEKMRKAAPARPRVEPMKSRKLLVITKCDGFVHGSIPYAAKALEIMGEATRAVR